ncbi:hypothetical protein T11_5546 [Trichinella zimbabwensis]|uniref:Uncharacterized protein n=1 Tax=Trichinella zimbabwensis TaxID=268475 RepID=A0A0V1GPT0_9BILA|nr:hypothetical protein T11_5546 [Trichinella zimbabwensis]
MQSASENCHFDAFYLPSPYEYFAVPLSVTMTLSIRRQDMEVLLSCWLSLRRVLFFQLASMDYISALEQVWSHSATEV